LKVHVKTVHYGIKEFACTDCPSTFFSKRNLILHTEKNHPELMGQFHGSNQVYKEEEESSASHSLSNHHRDSTDSKEISSKNQELDHVQESVDSKETTSFSNFPSEHQEPVDSKETNSSSNFLNYHRGSTDSKDNNSSSRFPIYHRDSTDSISNNANMYHSMYQEEMREREEAMRRVQALMANRLQHDSVKMDNSNLHNSMSMYQSMYHYHHHHHHQDEPRAPSNLSERGSTSSDFHQNFNSP